MIKVQALVEVLKGGKLLETCKKHDQNQVDLQRYIIQMKRESHVQYVHAPLKVSMIKLLGGE